MKTSTKIFAFCASAALLWGAWAAVRAQRDIVTLNVRDMDVRRVVKKIEWQTWENIVVHKEVQGKVTLNVRNMPLVETLRIIGEQTSSQTSSLYPLYSSRTSLANLQRALQGELDPATHGWTNLQSRGAFRGGLMAPRTGGPAGAADPGAVEQVSLQLFRKDVSFAALAFTRFARAQVVPEDGITSLVSLTLNKAPIKTAVAELAKKANRKWTQLYALRRGGGPGGPGRPMQVASGESSRTEPTQVQREEMQKQRTALEEVLLLLLPAAEREKAELAQKEREQQFKEMQNLTPEQRRERAGQMGGPNMSQRNLERIRNTTPEQRAEQRRQMAQMRQRGGPEAGRPGNTRP